MRAEAGVLLMAYGSPEAPAAALGSGTAESAPAGRRAAVEAYLAHVRHGRPPAAAQVDDLLRRYDAIGGSSPLLAVSRSQAEGVAAALGAGFRVVLGMKHAAPFLEDAIVQLRESGVPSIVGLVLAPHFSVLSVGEYHARAEEAAAGLAYLPVESWHAEPGWIELLSTRLIEGLDGLGRGPSDDRIEVVFTAHSLPARIEGTGDPYPGQLRATAEAVAARVGVRHWSVAWQSAPPTPEPWLGPDVRRVLPELAAAGRTAVLVCPAGFVSDHLEILYDLEVDARGVAERAGVAFARTRSANDDPLLCSTLARVVRSRLAGRDSGAGPATVDGSRQGD
ncbi:MAG: ferrochelatase [Acidimicrobiales bacterium]